MGRRRRLRSSPGALMVMRILLVSNAVTLTVVGFLSLLYVERPAGIVGAAALWLFAGGLLGCVPYTNPHRGDPW